jgi:succinate dehydrogenase/fumarate reductase-like Fe-S protein
MSKNICLYIDGHAVNARAGMCLAAAIAEQGSCCRRSVSGERRAPLCGMGVCGECRVTVDGKAHVLACQTDIVEGMTVNTHE